MTAQRRSGMVWFLALLGLWVTTGPALGQPRDIGVWAEANGGRVKVDLQVYVPLLGWVTVPVRQSPIAPSISSADGEPVEEQVADVNVPLGLVPMLEAGGVSNRVEATVPGPVVSATATSHVDEATLLNGLVLVKDLVAHVDLAGESFPDADPTITVTGTTYVQEITVAGVTLRLGEIPPNTTLPLVANLMLPVLGLTVPLPITATVTLNEQRPSGPHGLEVNALRVQGGGEVLGVARVNIDILLGGPAGEGNPVPPPVNPDICKRPGGYYQDRNNCSCFWQCDLAQRPYQHCCLDGLLFNEEARPGPVCDWPENVKCHG